MLRDTVLQHRAERDRFLAGDYVPRQGLSAARRSLDTDLIKVITGPRRAGKSVFGFLMLADVGEFAYLNFDDESLVQVSDYDALLATLFEVYPGTRTLYFDEIQNLSRWELLVSRLHRRGYNLVLTGSNARMLSGELATALTGRYVELEILPFSFPEALRAVNRTVAPDDLALPEIRAQALGDLDRYLQVGGMPEIWTKGLEPRQYLSTLMEAILFKDVVRRYGVRDPQRLYELSLYLGSSFGAEYSYTRLGNVLGFNSVNTVQSYVGYLEEAWLYRSLSRYSSKIGEQLRAPRKIYVMDTGYVAATAFTLSPNLGRLMENAVLLELLRRGQTPGRSVFYFRTLDGREVDFLTRSGTAVDSLIQVCRDLSDPRTEARELRSLASAADELDAGELMVLTWDDAGEDSVGSHQIHRIPLLRWLLEPPAVG